MLQLFGSVHGVDRHHHRIRPQNAKVSSYPLRAVLHVQQHPVSGLDTIGRQPASDAFGLLQQLAITDAATQKYQSIFIGEPFGVDFQVVPKSGLGRQETVWHATWPMGVMVFHGRKVSRES